MFDTRLDKFIDLHHISSDNLPLEKTTLQILHMLELMEKIRDYFENKRGG